MSSGLFLSDKYYASVGEKNAKPSANPYLAYSETKNCESSNLYKRAGKSCISLRVRLSRMKIFMKTEQKAKNKVENKNK